MPAIAFYTMCAGIPKKIRDKIFFYAIIYLTWIRGFESTFANEVLFTSGQLPNSLGAPQVIRTPATLQHCHSTGMTALVSIIAYDGICV